MSWAAAARSKSVEFSICTRSVDEILRSAFDHFFDLMVAFWEFYPEASTTQARRRHDGFLHEDSQSKVASIRVWYAAVLDAGAQHAS